MRGLRAEGDPPDSWWCTGQGTSLAHDRLIHPMDSDRCDTCKAPRPIEEGDSGRLQESARVGIQLLQERPGVYKVPGSNEEVGSVGNPASYYNKGGMQPFDIIDAFGLDFYEGSALKYLLRWRDKDGEADLLKVIHYVQEIIARHRKDIGDE